MAGLICYHAGSQTNFQPIADGSRLFRPLTSSDAMSNLLDRLAQNARAYLLEWLQRYGITEPPATWQDDPPSEPVHFEEPRAAASPLPRSAELEAAYRVLDLPFGAPLREAEREVEVLP